MNERTLLTSGSPITQSIDAVKTLLAYVGRGSDPLPTFLELPERRCILVLSNKKDVYYTVTQKVCSCPSATYRPGQPCKHQRKHFPEEVVVRNNALPEIIKPAGKWPGGFNGPVDPDMIETKGTKTEA